MKIIKIILTLFICIIVILNSQAQLQKTFGTVNNDYSQVLIKSDKSNFYMMNAFDLVSKIDTFGNFQWEKAFKTKVNSNFNLLSDAISTDSNQLIVLGSNHNTGGYYDNIFLSKFTSNGDTIWTQTYNNKTFNSCNGSRIITTKDGGYAIIGNASLYDGANKDILLIKTDSAGRTLWSKTYGGSGSEDGIALTETDNGEFIITGYTTSYGEGYQDIYLLKTNSIGDTIWTKTIGGNRNDTPSDIIKTSGNEYVITGFTSSYGIYYHDDDLFLLKIDDNGNVIWSRTYGGNKNEIASKLIQTNDSSIMVIGSTQSFGCGENDILLMKTNSTGNILFSKTYGGTSNDYGISIVESTSGYYILGDTRSFSIGGFDMCLIKVNANGTSSCRFKDADPVISTPVWKVNNGMFGNVLVSNNKEVKSNYSFTNQPIQFQTRDMCECNPPTALFTYNAMDGSVSFNDLSTWVDSWLWDFGNGITSSEHNPSRLITQDTNVCLTVKNECGSQTYCLKVNGGGGLKDNYLLQSITLSPNPAIDKISIDNLTEPCSIELLDLKGSVMLRTTVTTSENTLNLSQYDKGLYLYRISTNGALLKAGKIVKQ